MKEDHLTIRINSELKGKFKEHCKNRGTTISKLLTEFISKELNVKVVKEFKLIDTTEYYI